MKRKKTVPSPEAEKRETSRRDFLRLATAAGFAGSYAVSTLGQEEIEERPPGPPVSCGVIGIGLHGRRLLTLLARMPEARVKATCELYEPYRRRGVRMAPDATAYSDHDKLLKEADVEAVFVVTPTHLHREIVEAALAAGKHVYCEAPMASTIADARAIAEAAKGSDRIFTVGLQLRANPHYAHALTFLKVRAIGALVSDDSQFPVNSSWQRPVNNPS
ncbi:Gfo/Idh/MocA family oxidoreductase, partial [Candidatus Sumerlaeota bacterium]|nr:Gfo/Idh/MocA family oxidoreductase [Candidatus Sumerlaeota bacterium]